MSTSRAGCAVSAPASGVRAEAGLLARASALLAERQETRWKLGLSRMRGLLAALGDPQKSFAAVHVAGTNGKGSLCALLARALSEAGHRTGLYTSPHLVSAVERVRVDGEPIAEEDLARRVLEAQAAESEPATYFELTTAAAFLHFRERGVRIAVVEVGMGGRLDATNVLEDPALTAITSIGLDHVEHLGATPGRIASEKAGILKPGRPCLIGALEAEAEAAVRARAAETGSEVLRASAPARALRVDWERGVQVLEGGLELALLGEPAARAAALAADAARLLRAQGWDVPEAALARAFAGVRWPGRFQVLERAGKRLVLDGAHNPPALEAFLRTWAASPWARARVPFLVGVLADKDHRTMLAALARLDADFIAVRAPSPRALAASEVARGLRQAGARSVRAEPDLERAFAAWTGAPGPAAAACGSFYLVGRVLELLGEDP